MDNEMTREEVIQRLRNGDPGLSYCQTGFKLATSTAADLLESDTPTATAQRNVERLKKAKAKLRRYTHAWAELRAYINEKLVAGVATGYGIKQKLLELELERDPDYADNPPPNCFWLVWDEQRRTPTVKHLVEDSARVEAERLAKANPGHQFHVLQLLGTCRFAGLEWSDVDE